MPQNEDMVAVHVSVPNACALKSRSIGDGSIETLCDALILYPGLVQKQKSKMSAAGQSCREQTKIWQEISAKRFNFISIETQRAKEVKSVTISAAQLQRKHEQSVEWITFNPTNTRTNLFHTSRVDKQFWSYVYASTTSSPYAGTPTVLQTKRRLFLYVISVYAYEPTQRTELSANAYVSDRVWGIFQQKGWGWTRDVVLVEADRGRKDVSRNASFKKNSAMTKASRSHFSLSFMRWVCPLLKTYPNPMNGLVDIQMINVAATCHLNLATPAKTMSTLKLVIALLFMDTLQDRYR